MPSRPREYGAIRPVVGGGPSQISDAARGLTFHAEGGGAIAVVQVFDVPGDPSSSPRFGDLDDGVRDGRPENGVTPSDDAPDYQRVDGQLNPRSATVGPGTELFPENL